MHRREILKKGLGLAGTLALGGLLEASIRPIFAATSPNLNLQTNNLIQTDGTSLVDGNGQPIRLNGVNRYNLAGPEQNQCGGFKSAERPQWFKEVNSIGVNAVRLWLFQSQTQSGQNFDSFDEVLELAEENGIHVIPVLENHWDNCGGGAKNDEWYDKNYTSPYAGYDLSFPDYAELVTKRYKDNPTIAALEIANEPEAEHSILLKFADDMSSRIKSIAPNRLVSLGVMGNGQKGAEGNNYTELHKLPAIDLGSYHDYNNETETLPGDQWNGLQVRINQLRGLKPLIIGEIGIKLGTVLPDERVIDKNLRAQLVKDKYDAFNSQGVAGKFLWSYRDREGQDDKFGFDVKDPTDPLSEVIKNAA